ncbi:hypothetical protein ACCO45_010464 [Purpureocillium lilacinum]|uniref:Uncharacterized protein n=1 Tax=Purpureocillium lilacinum TaxID=33203 RepID=A0ACC4DEZ2_PURLI
MRNRHIFVRSSLTKGFTHRNTNDFTLLGQPWTSRPYDYSCNRHAGPCDAGPGTLMRAATHSHHEHAASRDMEHYSAVQPDVKTSAEPAWVSTRDRSASLHLSPGAIFWLERQTPLQLEGPCQGARDPRGFRYMHARDVCSSCAHCSEAGESLLARALRSGQLQETRENAREAEISDAWMLTTALGRQEGTPGPVSVRHGTSPWSTSPDMVMVADCMLCAVCGAASQSGDETWSSAVSSAGMLRLAWPSRQLQSGEGKHEQRAASAALPMPHAMPSPNRVFEVGTNPLNILPRARVPAR